MKVTLDFFGFTRDMEVPKSLFEHGVIEVQAVPPLRMVMAKANMAVEPYFKRLIFLRGIGTDTFKFDRVEG